MFVADRVHDARVKPSTVSQRFVVSSIAFMHSTLHFRLRSVVMNGLKTTPRDFLIIDEVLLCYCFF
jgi:hypothetical protein